MIMEYGPQNKSQQASSKQSNDTTFFIPHLLVPGYPRSPSFGNPTDSCNMRIFGKIGGVDSPSSLTKVQSFLIEQAINNHISGPEQTLKHTLLHSPYQHPRHLPEHELILFRLTPTMRHH